MWNTPLLPDALGRAFAEAPKETIWEWADKEVTLVSEDTAEPGPYRSAKTPLTRRLQELIKEPVAYEWDFASQSYIAVPLREINEMKSTQFGVTEAVLNGIRYKAKYKPVNTIYAMDTDAQARKVARRLLRSLKLLDADIFTGNPDDIKSLEFLLRGMELNFVGSFSSGKFASTPYPFVICDEAEEHGASVGDTSSLTNAESRKKTAEDGLQINLSKPKKENGLIHQWFLSGNQEEYFIACPHCEKLQYLTFFNTEREVPFTEEIVEIKNEQTGRTLFRGFLPLPPGQKRTMRTGRLAFGHCRDILGQWDQLRVLRETYYECGECKGEIREELKRALVDEGFWMGTAIGTPGIVSQHFSDLYSSDKGSSWGQIVLDFLKAKRKGREELQGFYNHRLGCAFANNMNKTQHTTIKANIAGKEGDGCPPYKRGLCPFTFSQLVLGSDVGGNYAKWALLAAHPNLIDAAVIDWGEEIDPDSIASIMLYNLWPYAADQAKKFKIGFGFIDGKFRRTEVNRACLAVPGHRLIPCAGLGGTAARVVKAWSYNPVGTYGQNFKQLTINDREAKDEMYEERLQKKIRRIWFPVDVDQDKEFMDELCAESKILDHGKEIWDPHPGPNHYGDCVKLAITGLRFMTRKMQALKGDTSTSK